MATITFSNGKTVNFNGTPTQADIDEVAQKVGGGTTATPAQPAKPDLLSQSADALTSLFPGTKTIGNALGTTGVELGQLTGLVPGGVKGFNETAATAPTVPQDAGAFAAAGATAYSAGAEGLGANALAGAVIGGGNSEANGESLAHTAESAIGGGALYGGTAGLAGVLGKAASYLPTRIAQKALSGATPETAEFALKNTKLGTINSLLSDSKTAINSLGKQVQGVLEHPDNAGKTISGGDIFQRSIDGNPAIPNSGLKNSGYTQPQIAGIIKKLVPNQGTLVSKLFSGDQALTLPEANTLRSSLDDAVKAVYINGQKIDAPAVAATKQVGAEVASALRENVKSQAKESVPIFQKLQQEINLRGALAKTAGKLDKAKAVGLYDILSGIGGFAGGGVPGAVGAYALEKGLRSPAVNLAAAKGLRASAPIIGKTATTVGKAVAPAITNALTK